MCSLRVSYANHYTFARPQPGPLRKKFFTLIYFYILVLLYQVCCVFPCISFPRVHFLVLDKKLFILRFYVSASPSRLYIFLALSRFCVCKYSIYLSFSYFLAFSAFLCLVRQIAFYSYAFALMYLTSIAKTFCTQT